MSTVFEYLIRLLQRVPQNVLNNADSLLFMCDFQAIEWQKEASIHTLLLHLHEDSILVGTILKLKVAKHLFILIVHELINFQSGEKYTKYVAIVC